MSASGPPPPDSPASPRSAPPPFGDDLDRLLRRALAVLPPPAPPPFPDVLARFDVRAPGGTDSPPWRAPVRVWRALRTTPRYRARVGIAAAVLLIAGAIVGLRRSAPDAGRGVRTEEVALELLGVHALRNGEEVPPRGGRTPVRAGDILVADAAGFVRLGSRAVIELERGARVRLGAGSDGPGSAGVALLDGRATFQVHHDESRAFEVATTSVRVVDRGTRFAVEVSPEAGGERVLVTVEEGVVEVVPAGSEGPPPSRLRAGTGLAFVRGAPTGAPFELAARPTLALEAEEATPTSSRPVIVRLVFDNPTDGWLALPAYDPVRTPIHVQVRGPDGSMQAVRVAEKMLVDGGGSGRSLPPRGRLVLRVRFEHTFASPGTYRLRAIYRPAGAVDEGASPELVLPVR